MSTTLTEAISAAQSRVDAAYAAALEKGATMPSVQNLANLPDTIRTIDGGEDYSRLPAEYYELPYVAFTGEQWVDTGIVIDSGLEIHINLVDLAMSTSTDRMYYGCTDGTTSLYLESYNKQRLYFRFGMSTSQNILRPSEKLDVTHKAGSIKINGTNTATNKSTAFPNVSLALGARKNASGQYQYPALMLLRAFSIKESGLASYAVDYVPALRLSDNKVGLYDLANNTFVTSQSGVDFIGG